MRIIMIKYLFSILFLAAFLQAEPPPNLPEIYTDVFAKWPSPTPWLKDRFSDFLEQMPKRATVVEIGVQQGGFSAHILSKTNPKKLYLVDCWEYQNPLVYDDPETNVENAVQERYYRDTRKRFSGDRRVTIVRKYSKDALSMFKDESIDWVYIDANHGYLAAKEDIALWWPKVKKGGFLAGHDYVIRPSFGVLQAVNEFLRDHNLYFSFLTTEDGKHDSWAIQKP